MSSFLVYIYAIRGGGGRLFCFLNILHEGNIALSSSFTIQLCVQNFIVSFLVSVYSCVRGSLIERCTWKVITLLTNKDRLKYN